MRVVYKTQNPPPPENDVGAFFYFYFFEGNLLAALPRTPLPETLVELVLSENRLTELPEAWPETLEAGAFVEYTR